MMKFTKTLSAIAALICAFTSCQTKEKPEQVPTEGVAEYDIFYSNNMRNNGIIGKILPTKARVEYNNKGIKCVSQSGFGIAKVDITSSVDDSFLTLDINGDKYIVSFADLFTESDYEKRDNDIRIVNSEQTDIVAGWESKLETLICKSPYGEFTIEIHYVPVDHLNRKLKDSPIPYVPGLITAMRICNGETDILIMLNNVKEEQVGYDILNRPSGFKDMTRKEIDSLIINNLGPLTETPL